MSAVRAQPICPTRSRDNQHPEQRADQRTGVKQLISESGGIGAEIIRHAMLLIGVVGLVAIATGALTDCPAYWSVLNWVSSCFCRG